MFFGSFVPLFFHKIPVPVSRFFYKNYGAVGNVLCVCVFSFFFLWRTVRELKKVKKDF